MVDLNPVVGHEQGARRPAVVLSTSRFNASAAELVVVAPMTKRDRGVPLHIAIDPPEGGLAYRSYVLCDQLRTISKQRLVRSAGVLSTASMEQIADRLRILLEL